MGRTVYLQDHHDLLEVEIVMEIVTSLVGIAHVLDS